MTPIPLTAPPLILGSAARPALGKGTIVSQESTTNGLPREIEEWLHSAVDTDTGRTSLLAYTLARLLGFNPTQSIASAVLFEIDADRTWTSAGNPTRGELFATAERTILQPPAPFLPERAPGRVLADVPAASGRGQRRGSAPGADVLAAVHGPSGGTR